MSKVILNPYFNECSNYCLDDYWKDIFVNCSYNIFPQGMYYNRDKNELTISRNRKKSILVLSEPKHSYKDIIEIFRNDFSLFSVYDIKIRKQEKDKSLSNIEEWKSVKLKQTKEFLITNYINEKKDEYNMTKKQMTQSMINIKLGLQFKQIKPEDIILTQRKIEKIESVKYDEKSGQIVCVEDIERQAKYAKPTTKKIFNRYINRFVKDNIK